MKKNYTPVQRYFKDKIKAEKFLTEIQEDGYWGYITEKNEVYTVHQQLVPILTTGYYKIREGVNVESYI
jgi:hypothetical protein